ncbi:hypothetical protein BDF19DRAFT_420144 [Syncephalis fuscata]|nr:hypothetical protein BDF19DRAFT_420144 [Syncephalis fuscata]
MADFTNMLRFPALAAHVQQVLYGCFSSEELAPFLQTNERDDTSTKSTVSFTSTVSTLRSYYDAKSQINCYSEEMESNDDYDDSTMDDQLSEKALFQRQLRGRPSTCFFRNECPWELPPLERSVSADNTISTPIAKTLFVSTVTAAEKHAANNECYRSILRNNSERAKSTIITKNVNKKASNQWPLVLNEGPMFDQSKRGQRSGSYSLETQREHSHLAENHMKHNGQEQFSRWGQLRQRAASLALGISTSFKDNVAMSSESSSRRMWFKGAKSPKRSSVLTMPETHCRSYLEPTPELSQTVAKDFDQNSLQSNQMLMSSAINLSQLALLSSIVNRQVQPTNIAPEVAALTLREQEHKVIKLLEALAKENEQKWSGIRDSLYLHRAQNSRDSLDKVKVSKCNYARDDVLVHSSDDEILGHIDNSLLHVPS